MPIGFVLYICRIPNQTFRSPHQQIYLIDFFFSVSISDSTLWVDCVHKCTDIKLRNMVSN
jgi:hypothetical protein